MRTQLRSGPDAGSAPDTPTWYRLWPDTPDLTAILQEQACLDGVTIQALLAEETRPRCTPHGGGALVILRGIDRDPGTNPEDLASVRIWIDGSCIVTYQRRQLKSVSDLEQAIANGTGPQSSGDFLVTLADRLTDHMQEVIDATDNALDALEDASSRQPIPQLRKAITNLRRKVVILRRFIAPQRDALDVLVAEPFEWQTTTQERRLKDIVDRITRQVEQLDEVHMRASIVHDMLSVRVAERLNRTMMLLSVVACIFLPLSFLTGLLGINVGGIPGEASADAFWIVTGVLGLLALVELVFIWRMRLF